MSVLAPNLMCLLAQASNQAPSQPDTITTLVWAVVLIGAALALVIIEAFVPSGGVIGLLAATSLIAGVIMLFRVNTVLGLVGATVALIAIPFVVVFLLNLWPNTPIGRMLTLRDDDDKSKQEEDESESEPKVENAGPRVDQSGKAVTDLRPVGTCLIDGRREECLAERGMIEAGTPIRVVSVDGKQIKVRPESQA